MWYEFKTSFCMCTGPFRIAHGLTKEKQVWHEFIVVGDGPSVCLPLLKFFEKKFY